MSIPPLPHDQIWPENTHHAIQNINETHTHAIQLLNQDEADPLQLEQAARMIINDSIPLLSALESDQTTSHPAAWLKECAEMLGKVLVQLLEANGLSDIHEESNIRHVNPVATTIGKRGRPRKVVDPTFLQEAMSTRRNISISSLAKSLGISRPTLRRNMNQSKIYRRFHQLSDENIDMLVRQFKLKHPNLGIRYLIAYFRSKELRIQRRRIYGSVRRVDPVGQLLRKKRKITRRRYKVKRPNSVWHLDGHHKLIQYGIVIHGMADGYSRLVTGLRASNNNRASTVLDLFLDVIMKYGCPSRMRGDRGGENVYVSAYMIMKQGRNRGSFLWGSSTHNTRIERLWVEVGKHFCRNWKAFFIRLEFLHGLQKENPHHLWLLHYLFLDEINDDCADFMTLWNSKPISGRDANNKSPNDMYFMGMVNEGMYQDEYFGVHPDILGRYLGTSGSITQRSGLHTGAGSTDEVGTNDVHGIASDNANEEIVNTPSSQCPFTPKDMKDLFQSSFNAVRSAHCVPSNMRISDNEWITEAYPESEIILVRGKEVEIDLPLEIWKPRALSWCQALSTMVSIQARLGLL